MEEYGFQCDCGRCEVEKLQAQYEEEEEEEAEEVRLLPDAKRKRVDPADGAAENEEQVTEEEAGESDASRSPGYVMMFLLKYLCDRCGGHLVPCEPPDHPPSNLVPPAGGRDDEELQRCVVCSRERTAAEFEALLEEMGMAAEEEEGER